MGKERTEPKAGTATDIGELQDTLGVIIASYTYLFDPWARVEEVNHMITYEGAILQGLGKFNNISADGKTRYRDLFTFFRARWQVAVEQFEQDHGGWKDSIKIVSELRDSLLRIAVTEGLITLSSDMFTIQIPQMPAPMPPGPGGQQGGMQPGANK
jgi:hypothetical protein